MTQISAASSSLLSPKSWLQIGQGYGLTQAYLQDVDDWAAAAATEYYEKGHFKFAYLTLKQIR